MQVAKIKNLINATLAAMGHEVGSVDDFSWEDTGKTLANMTAADYATYLNKFALGVIRTEFDSRVWERTLDIMTDVQTYNGIKQYIKASPLTADDVSIVALINGVDYNDRVYKDLATDNLLFTKDFGFQFSWCVPQAELAMLFSSEETASNYVTLINATVSTSFNRAKWVTQLSLLVGLISTAYQNGQVVHLVTEYNATHPQASAVTTATAMSSDDFKRWCLETVANLGEYVRDISKKYNDGQILTFSSSDDMRKTLLTQFANALKNVAPLYSVEQALPLGRYNTVNAWQDNGSTALLPGIATCGAIADNTDPQNPVTISDVVGVLYDYWSVGLTTKVEKVTSDYVPKGDFTKFFGSFVGQGFINTRNNALVLCLD